MSGRIRGALELPGDRDTASRESVSPYDVAFLRAGSNWAGDAALFSLLHAGVVRVDEDGKLRRGSKPLPDDAPKIERCVLERVAGLDAKSTREVVVARVDRLAQGSVILFAVVTTVALQWTVSTAGPTGEGLRETPSFLVDAPILVRGPYGGSGRPKPMPPVVRRHRSAACDPEAVARAEKTPLAMLAEIDRREREAEGPRPLTAEARAHLGVAGSLYGVTKDRLFEITLCERRVTTREVAPLLVAVPVLGPERALQEDEYFSGSVDALGFDRNGLLWATGDERLYDCSVATGICVAQGILSPDAWSIWFADNPQGERFCSPLMSSSRRASCSGSQCPRSSVRSQVSSWEEWSCAPSRAQKRRRVSWLSSPFRYRCATA